MFVRTLMLLFATMLMVSCGKSSADGEAAGSNAGGGTSIQNTGSDTMVNLAQAWAEVYRTVKPDVSIEVSGGGSGVGISALRTGTVDIANASRAIKPSEAQQAKANTGKDPKEFIVGYDGIGIYVHKDNPIEEITLAQLGEIYGEAAKITKWSQLGVKLEPDAIVIYSRQSNSGTYQFFREAVLGKGDFRRGTLDMHGSKDVVDAIEKTEGGIGYSGMGYKTEGVKFVNVSKGSGEPAFMPTVENVLSGTYPIARPLHMYTLGEPEGEIKAYLDWAMSPAGQAIVSENGYVPLAGK